MFSGIHGKRQMGGMRDHLPGRAGEELAMTETIEQVPDGVLDGEVRDTDRLQAFGVRAQQVILAPTGILAVPQWLQPERGKIIDSANSNSGAAVAGFDGEGRSADAAQVARQRGRDLSDALGRF